MPDFARLLEAALVAQLALGVLSELGGGPGYNVALPFWGLYAVYARNARALLLFLSATALCVVIDIAWMGIYGA